MRKALVQLETDRTRYTDRPNYFHGTFIGSDNAGPDGHLHFRIDSIMAVPNAASPWPHGEVVFIPAGDIFQVTRVD